MNQEYKSRRQGSVQVYLDIVPWTGRVLSVSFSVLLALPSGPAVRLMVHGSLTQHARETLEKHKMGVTHAQDQCRDLETDLQYREKRKATGEIRSIPTPLIQNREKVYQ